MFVLYNTKKKFSELDVDILMLYDDLKSDGYSEDDIERILKAQYAS